MSTNNTADKRSSDRGSSVGTLAGVVSAILAIITFVGKDNITAGGTQALHAIGAFLSGLAGGVGRFAAAVVTAPAFGPILLALLLLGAVFFVRMRFETAGIFYSATVTVRYVLLGALLCLPIAAIWIWLFYSKVPVWASGVFLAGYMATIIGATWWARGVPTVRNEQALQRAAPLSISIGLATLTTLAFVVREVLAVSITNALHGIGAALSALASRGGGLATAPAFVPILAAVLILLAIFLLRLGAEKIHLFYTRPMRLSDGLLCLLLFTPLLGLWLWLYFPKEPLWAVVVFVLAYIVTVFGASKVAADRVE